MYFQTYTGCMDTIIYFFRNRETDNFITEKWREDDYCLIWAGVPPFVWGRKEWSNREACRIAEWQIAIRLLSDNPYQISCVYEDALRKALVAENLRKIWCANWPVWEFDAYHERKWAQKLMPYAKHNHFVIVGDAPCLPELLCENAARMRSIRWILQEEQYTCEVREFIDDFYEENGLVIEAEVLRTGDTQGARNLMRITSVLPVNVLDFSGEEKLSACDMAQGSIWIDMDSLEGKCRRMEARPPGISYFSLKKEWGQTALRQKALILWQKAVLNLDTEGKNGYNTGVN